MLQTYKKIACVREPMERLVSAYQNKFAQDYEDRSFHHKFGKDIIKKYRKNFTGEVTDEHYTKFSEFVKYLIDLPPNKERNEHWKRQHKLCSPCVINYDFVGKYDTLKSDAARALEIMGASDVVTFPENRKKPEGLACVSQKIRKLLGPGNRPAKLPKRLSGVSQSTRKLLTPKNTSFFPVNFTGTHYLPKSVFGSVFLVLA